MGSLASTGLMVGSAALVASALAAPLLAGRRKLAGWVNAVASLLAATAFGAAGAATLATGEATFRPAFGFVGIVLLLDGFSALFLILISLMAAVAAFYAVGYMEHYRQYGLAGFYFHYPIFVLGMAGVVLVDDLGWGFSFAWQLMTVASFFLIRFDRRDRAVVRSANKYLALMELAWLLVVAGAAALPGPLAGATLADLARGLATAPAGLQTAAIALVVVGFALKAGVFPLGQLWLPDAHSSAPSPISALLSGVMIKTGVYGIVRTLFWMAPAPSVAGWRYAGLTLAAFGVASLFIGTVQALKQRDAKRLHAWSSIGQMGYIVLAVGSAHFLLAGGSSALRTLSALALAAAVYHTLNHAMFKGLLFLVSGSVQYATGTRDMDRLGGLVRRMPATAVVAAIAAASIAGVPAFSGFASKWALIASGLLAGGQAPALVVFGIVALMTSAITLACYVKFFGTTFTSSGSEWRCDSQVREVGPSMLLPKAVLAAICIAQGLFPWVFIGLIGRALALGGDSVASRLFADPGLSSRLVAIGPGLAVSVDGSVAVGVVTPLVIFSALSVALLFAAWLRRTGGAARRADEPWMCGYQRLNDFNRYPSSHLFDAFRRVTRWTSAGGSGVQEG
ncbi:MAG: proton-conducting transporter membrane subunit [Vicinamibacterales bacterium]